MLNLRQLEAYVHLAGVVETDTNKPSEVLLSVDLLDNLLSLDIGVVRKAADELNAEEQDLHGSKHEEARSFLIETFSDPRPIDC